MKQYVRTNEEGDMVLDYDLLDVAARSNFLNDLKAWAGNMEVLVDFEDAEFTEAEKREAIESHVNVEIDHANLTVDGEEAEIEPDTRSWMQEILEAELFSRYL